MNSSDEVINFNVPAWIWLERKIKEYLEKARDSLECDRPEVETAKLRGDVRTLKQILKWKEEMERNQSVRR